MSEQQEFVSKPARDADAWGAPAVPGAPDSPDSPQAPDGPDGPRPGPEIIRLSREVVGRFVLDPQAFARSARVEPQALTRAYGASVDRRLAALLGEGPNRRRGLATFADLDDDGPLRVVGLFPPGTGSPQAEAEVVRMGVVAVVSASILAVVVFATLTSSLAAAAQAAILAKKPL